MRISVALCTFDGARWLGAQLASIAAQTHAPHELVLRDDGSADGTLDVARRFAEGAPFPVRILESAGREGVAANFAAAARACAGDFVAFCDQDDVWHPDKLATLARAADAAGDADLVFADARCVDADLRPLGYTLWESLGLSRARRLALAGGDADAVLDVLLWRNVVAGTAAMVRASRLELVLPIGDGWIHDGWTALLLALWGRVVPVATSTLDYRQHGANQVGARRLAPGERAERARAAMFDEYRRQHDALARLRDHARALRPRLAGEERARLDARLPKVEMKLAHLARRAGLPEARIARVPAVLGELVRGRYARYASGLASAARDLVVLGHGRPTTDN